MAPEVGEDEEQMEKHKREHKGMVDVDWTIEACPKSEQECQVNGKCASCMQIELASPS